MPRRLLHNRDPLLQTYACVYPLDLSLHHVDAGNQSLAVYMGFVVACGEVTREGCLDAAAAHVSEAIPYRSPDRSWWNG